MNINELFTIQNTISVVLLLCTILLVIKLLNTKSEHAKDKEQAIADKTNLEAANQLINSLNAKTQNLEDQISSLQESRTKLIADKNQLSFDNDRLNKESEQLNESIDNYDAQLKQINAENAELRATVEANEKLNAELEKRFEANNNELKEQMKVIGNSLVKAGTEDLNKSSKENLEKLVNPLKEELNIFKKFLADTQENNAKRSGELQKEIKLLEESHTTLSKQAEDLTKALRSGGKSQGMWGELQLERILEASGLKNGVEYEREVAGSRALGENGRPDAIIRLPQNHCVIIDAKCSLTAYTNYINAETEEQKEQAMKAHLASIKSHLDELIKKDYSSYQTLNSPSFVFMFVPIDSALTEALRYDSSLYDNAARNKIYLVSPSSILPALRVVSNLWILSEQTDKMRELARIAQAIFEKFNNITESCDSVFNAEKKLNDSLEQLRGRLFTGKGNSKTMLEKFDKNAKREFKEIDGQVIDRQEQQTELLDQVEIIDN